MNGGVRMVICSALASFGAGIGVGLALPVLAAGLEQPQDIGRDQLWGRDYVRNLGIGFDLSATQRTDLRAIVQSHIDEVASIVREADYSEWPPDQRRRIKDARDLMDRRIRSILTDEQRGLYDAGELPGSGGADVNDR